MQTRDELKATWKDMAALIASLSIDEQTRYQSALRTLVQDLRHSVSIIYGAETLLRRNIPTSSSDTELLDTIRTSNQRIIGLITDFAQPFDREITLPLGGPPSEPGSES